MPSFAVNLKIGAGVALPLITSVGGNIPVPFRFTSRNNAVSRLGASAPPGTAGAGQPALAVAPPALLAAQPVGGLDVQELDNFQQRQFTGGRPSGFAEAFKAIEQRKKTPTEKKLERS